MQIVALIGPFLDEPVCSPLGRRCIFVRRLSSVPISGGATRIGLSSTSSMGGGQMMTVTQDNDSYYASRADAMHTIESTIVELGGIFTQLAHMVKEQQEMVERIDSNVEDTALNVEMGHNEILK